MNPWKSIHSLNDIPDEIEIRVDYYRKNDCSDLDRALRDHKTGDLHPRVVLPSKEGEVVKIPKAEFLAYWLFEDKVPADPSLANFEALALLAEDTLPALRNYFETSSESVRAKNKPEGFERPTDISTRLGVTVGLCVVNKVVSLTRADWMKIPKTYEAGKEERRFDYQLAASPVDYVAVENKGSITTDNRLKRGLSDHEASIVGKKESLRTRPNPGVLIGAISVADGRDDSRLKCWLLDPPIPKPENLPPEVFRVLNRLRFQRSLVQMVLPMSYGVHDAMEERESEILREQSIVTFEGKALKYPSRGRIRLKWNGDRKVHAIGKNGLWVGMITRLKQDQILFAGLGKRWVNAALGQKLQILSRFDGTSTSGESKLEWHATGDELAMLSGFSFTRGEAKHDLTPVSLPVTLHETKGGFAFAICEKKIPTIREITRVRMRKNFV